MDERTLNDLLECSVCLERLDTSSKVLPCQHTFCRKCLEVIVSSHNELRCPECRILVDVRIDDLPPNVLLQRILEGMKSHKSHQAKPPEAAAAPAKVSPPAVANNTEQAAPKQQHSYHPQAAPQRRCQLPHAYALFDFDSHEDGDLRFKKGDLILLKRKIDSNWYVGQLNGVEGSFPINYVQVIAPLQSPQCVALYDFKMGPQEEEGCLAFKKGTTINVLRRVDQNWAEGRIGGNIGIFPIAFVELNSLARRMLESEAAEASPPSDAPEQSIQPAHQEAAERHVPPIPADASPLATQQNSAPAPALAEATAPGHYERIASSSSSVRFRDQREKRHSLNTLLSSSGHVMGASSNLLKANRHSAEILSIPSELSAPARGTERTSAMGPEAAHPPTGGLEHLPQHSPPQRVNVLKTCTSQTGAHSLPWGYLALYSYQPRKSDELELKKGCIYIVTERCLDGWFKGKNWQNICGVFPGNYVQPLRERDQQQLMHQWKFVPNAQQSGSGTAGPHMPVAAPTHLQSPPNGETAAPELPPRHAPSGFAAYKSVWIKPLNQTVEAFFNRQGANKAESSPPTGVPSKADALSAPSSTTTCSSSAVSLMKRLTNIKGRSKSPSMPPHQPLQAVNAADDGPAQMAGGPEMSKPAHVHVRSGSCPSQLLQHPSAELIGLPHPAQGSPQCTYGSKRAKANKERPPLPMSCGGPPRLAADQKARAAVQHVGLPPPTPLELSPPPDGLPPAMLPAKCSTQQKHTQMQQQQQHQQLQHQQQQQQQLAAQFYHRKSQSLDASALIRPPMQNVAITGPPSQQQHITAAAIAASATTKSQCTRESRFRCIVPYPPNSDIELELHVGDIIYVQRKQKNGWYKGTHARTNKTGLFPASFVEPDP